MLSIKIHIYIYTIKILIYDKKTRKIKFNWVRCPVPVLKLAKKIKEIKVGDILVVDVDDPKADNDIEQLVKNINIKLLNKIKKKEETTFYIEKI